MVKTMVSCRFSLKPIQQLDPISSNFQGLVNVPFWGFWTSPSNICWKLYPQYLGDVQLGHLPTPDFISRKPPSWIQPLTLVTGVTGWHHEVAGGQHEVRQESSLGMSKMTPGGKLPRTCGETLLKRKRQWEKVDSNISESQWIVMFPQLDVDGYSVAPYNNQRCYWMNGKRHAPGFSRDGAVQVDPDSTNFMGKRWQKCREKMDKSENVGLIFPMK